jgi:glutathione S-transferase
MRTVSTPVGGGSAADAAAVNNVAAITSAPIRLVNSGDVVTTLRAYPTREVSAVGSRGTPIAMMKLYGFPPTRSIRVLWTLRELGVDFEFVTVNLMAGENRSPEFLALNPAGKVPVLVDGDFVLTESVAIVLYLAEKYAEKGLLPTAVEARARVHRWLLFSATELEQPLWRIARHTAIYPKEKRLADEVLLARQDFESMAAVMEEHMKGRTFLVGDSMTVADLVAAYTLDWANEVHLLDVTPRLRAYMEEMYARPQAPPRIAQALASVRAAPDRD